MTDVELLCEAFYLLTAGFHDMTAKQWQKAVARWLRDGGSKYMAEISHD